ncbi:hypothetical protein SEPCBS57363_006130 [Sporothrix epigloea]|uniref:WD repeat protein n=1 Tax=Sporothrix epigloea TaxID=1892477 RepID=A0ABP0E5J4_9PEZI
MSAPRTPDDTSFRFGGQNGNFGFLQQVLQFQGVDDNNNQHTTLDTEDHDDNTHRLFDVDEDENEDDGDYQDDDEGMEEESETEEYTHDVDDIEEGDEGDDDNMQDRFPKVPSEHGRKLMDSGIFGTALRSQRIYLTSLDGMVYENPPSFAKVGARRRPTSLRLFDRELGFAYTQAERGLSSNAIAQSSIPDSEADLIMQYPAPVYLGQFSDDGNFFYNATKDFRVRMYDTSNVNEWKHYKTVVHPAGRWTMTDADLSPDNKWLAFTSMMPQVCLAPTDPNDKGEPYLLNLGTPMPGAPGAQRYYHNFAIFSVRFSGDGRELVAGNSDAAIVVYDIESRTVLHNIEGHKHDVNAVCFGDKLSPHLLYSGSDDATIKVWDRRSLGDGRAAGAFVGHCEGITYIDSKGDGRYILSNGKDQTMRLWDLRMAISMPDFDAKDPLQLTSYSLYDYRFQRYNDDLFFKHPHDNSVVTFRGHRVERTLIRCHFSPPGSSDGRYVYSGCHSGKVHIWNMDATVAGQIDICDATQDTMLACINAERDMATMAPVETPSSLRVYDDRRHGRQRLQNYFSQDSLCVRDASWHPTAPVLATSFFDAEGMEMGGCSVHSCNLAKDAHEDGPELRLHDHEMRPIFA